MEASQAKAEANKTVRQSRPRVMRCAILLTLLFGLATVPDLGLSRARDTAPLIGFYVPWDANGRASFSAHADALSIFAPQWISLKTTDGSTVALPDDNANTILSGTSRPPLVMPLVSLVIARPIRTLVAYIIGPRFATSAQSESAMPLTTQRDAGAAIGDAENSVSLA